jgi:hypothetical protein
MLPMGSGLCHIAHRQRFRGSILSMRWGLSHRHGRQLWVIAPGPITSPDHGEMHRRSPVKAAVEVISISFGNPRMWANATQKDEQ